MADVANPADPTYLNDPKEMGKLLKRVRAGDESTLPVVRKLLDEPGAVERLGGNVAALAERSFIKALGGDDLLFREAVARKLGLMRAELCGPNPTPLERLLVSRIVACWLQVQDADVRYAQGQKASTMAQGEYQQRRQDRAHRRYLSAIRTLALVRKLALPVLQVNIAEKQVNVAGG